MKAGHRKDSHAVMMLKNPLPMFGWNLCSCILSALALFSADPGNKAPSQNRVTVQAAAFDRHGEPVSLAGSNAQVFAQDRELPVSSVDDIQALPLHVAIVVDRSFRQRRVLPTERSYAARLASFANHPNADFTLVESGREPKTLVRNASPTTLASDLEKFGAEGRTDDPTNDDRAADPGQVFAAIAEELKTLSKLPGARTMVVFAEGSDNISGRLSLDDLKTQAAAAHITCFVVLVANHDFFGTKARPQYGNKLRKLADASGGDTFETDWQNRKADEQILRQVGRQISNGTLLTLSVPAEWKPKAGLCKLTLKTNRNGDHLRLRLGSLAIP